MTEENNSSGTKSRKLTAKSQLAREQALRKERLAKQLRTNLQKRKAQGRSRRDGLEDQRSDGLQIAPEGSQADGSTHSHEETQ